MNIRGIGSKGAVPEQIPVNFVIILAIFAMGGAVLLLMIGKWLDITGVKYKMETQRNAMSLLQLIVSNSPVVKRDSADEPLKLVLDAEKLTEYQNFAGMGMESLTAQRQTWESCCEFLDFDYNFTVHDLVTYENWTIGNLIFKQISDCYPKRVKGFSDVPVVIEEDGRNHAGVAVVDMTRTPLSELSFWLSQAFVRASWDEYWDVYSRESKYTVKISLDPEIQCVKFIDADNNQEADCVNNYGRVCIILNVSDNREVCKMYVCDSSVDFHLDGDHSIGNECFDSTISVKNDEVSIFYPGDCE